MAFDVFKITDLVSFSFWAFVITVYTYLHYHNHKHLAHYRFYIGHMVYKIFFAFLFASIYVFYYAGGDTLWYWDGAVKMVNLLMDEPGLYINQMFSNPSNEKYYNYFNPDIGYPPSWIYKEPDSFYVSKIASIFGLLTMNSFFAMTLLFAFFAAHSTWKLYEVVLKQKITKDSYAALAILFIPSVNFWASGIIKDTIVLICSYYLIVIVYRIFIEKSVNRRFLLGAVGLLFIYWIFKTRAFMLLCLLPCLLIWVNYEVLAGIKNNLVRRLLIPVLFLLMTGGVGIVYISSSSSFGSYSSENIVNTAMVIQQDFQGNEFYSENRYFIGKVDGSPQSMILVMPAAIIAAFYRPFIWEANTILMLFSGLESIFFLFLTARFLIRFQIYKWFFRITENKFLLFALIFCLILGYFVGFTGGIFGALVRFKTPILPFLVLILLMEKKVPPSPRTNV